MKKILLPISVPDGDYCFGGPRNKNGILEICEKFTNENGPYECDLKFNLDKMACGGPGCRKSIACLKLTEA